ncbi:MAG: LruC domain-containing protein [Bacteroidales bacterium]|nr:LruC domain-containing protein [Bacteroidales bacterium]
MKKAFSLYILLLIIAGVTITSCIKAPKGNTDEENKEYFDFATIGTYTLSLDYKLKFNSPIVFFVYDQYPYKTSPNDPGLEVLDTQISPILKGLATNFGKYSGVVTIKKTVKQLYIYSTTIGVPQLLKSTFANNIFAVDASNPANYVEMSTVKSGSGFAQNAILPGDFRTLGTWNNSGLPNYLLSPDATITAELINVVNASLPESKPVPTYNPHYITNGVSSALRVIADATVEVVFIHEGAGYKNVLGYFHYPTNSPPTSVNQINKIIAFPNSSYAGSGGALSSGNRVQLKYWNGTDFVNVFPAGTSIGWYIVANGFSNGTISQTAPRYYSLEQFNPESNPLLKPHNVLLYDPQRQLVIIGFEDLPRSGGHSDDDFNDAIFYAVGTPVTAIDYGDLPVVEDPEDSDGDGIPDDRDEFPNDPDVAYSTHYPAQNVYHTLAYEDLWPTRGDYDMNDVIVTYNSTHFLNVNNKVVKVIDRFKPVWSGGILDVGFGYQMGVASSAVKSTTKTSDFVDNNFRYTLNANGTETQQSKATIMVFDNITEMGLTTGAPKPSFSFEIKFNSPVNVGDLTTPPYNPFIVVNKNRGMEIHMPGYKPTDRADYALFGTYDDRSNPSLNRFYVSTSEMPWGIIIPNDNFDFPIERESIVKYYPKFLPWAESFGVEFPDWYLHRRP